VGGVPLKRSNPLLVFVAGMAAGFFLAIQFRAEENDQAILLLEKTLRAPAETQYHATSVTYCYLPKELKVRAEVWHKGPYRERITYLSGPMKGYTIGCDGLRNWQSNANATQIKVAGRRASDDQAKQRFDLLVRNYQVTLDGVARIARRRVYILTIKPRNPGNPWKRLWVDQVTAVALRTDDYLPNNRLKTRTILETIDYSAPIDDSLFDVPASAAGGLQSVPTTSTRAMPPDLIREIYQLDPPPPRYLPRGYELERHYLYQCECGDKAVLTRFIDGLNTISVFAIPTATDAATAGEGSDAAVRENCCIIGANLPSVTVKHKGRDYRIVVLGDIAEGELRRVMDSFQS